MLGLRPFIVLLSKVSVVPLPQCYGSISEQNSVR